MKSGSDFLRPALIAFFAVGMGSGASSLIAQVPDLSANLISGPSSAQAGTTISVTRNITNIGGTTGWNGSFTYDVCLSTDTTIESIDPLVATISSSANGTQSISVAIPASIAVGTYFLGIIVHPVSGEGNISNNSIASTGTLQISAAAPDLNAVSISGPAIIVPGQQLAVTRNITNVGGPITASAMVYEIRLSTDTTLTTADPLIATFNTTTLGILTTPNFMLPIGIANGSYYFGMVVGTTTGETNAANNVVVSTSTTSVVPAWPTLSAIVPAEGPSVGGTIVTITGLGTSFDSTTSVTVNGAPSPAVTTLSATTVVFETPPNPQANAPNALVVVTTQSIGQSLSGAFTYYDLGSQGSGNVGLGLGGPFDLLTINGSAGLPARRVDVGLGSPITISVAQPPTNPLPSAFAVIGYIGVPTPADAYTLPFGIGTLCFPAPQLFPATPGLFTLTNNFGPEPGQLVGSNPAPWSFTAAGLPFAFQFTLQGVIQQDPGTVRVMNGVIVNVQ